MQLLLLFLLLSAQGGGYKEIQPLLEDIGGEDIKNALGEAEAIASVLEMAKAFMSQPHATENNQTTDYEAINSGKNTFFTEISSFADPEIVEALVKCFDG